MRRKIIIGNWKMNYTDTEARTFLVGLKESIDVSSIDVCVAPPFTSLKSAREILDGTGISIGAQNVFYEEAGSYTGEISADMLKDLNVEYCIVGHSERRKHFNETDNIVHRKVMTLIENNIKPIICIGEDIDIRNNGNYLEYIENELRTAIDNIDIRKVKDMIIAYEPIWAIGTGKSATSDEAESVCSELRYLVQTMYGTEVSESIRILYGGSVTSNIAEEFVHEPNIDGFLVGGASLNMDFAQIIKNTEVKK